MTTRGSCLDQATLATEIALSGSEQNGDLTAKNLRLLAGRVRPGPTPEVRAFQERGVDFVSRRDRSWSWLRR